MLRRLVCLDFTRRTATVYENKTILAVYEIVPEEPLSKDDIEVIRIEKYGSSA